MSKSVDIEGIYLRLPITMQNLITNFYGWRIKATRFNLDFDRILRETEKRGAASLSVRRAYRDEALHKFIVHAAQSVPYYQRLFAEWGLNPNDMRSLTDLQRLPSLDKATVQANMSDLISRSVPPKKQVMIHTSGTTGGGLQFPTTQQAIHAQWATWWRYRHWHGLRQNTWCGYFGGRSIVPLSQTNPPFWRINYPGRQILFSAYHLSFATVSAYVAELNRRRPPWLHGYPSLLTLLASLMQEQNLSLDYRLQWITVGAENLLQQQSNKIMKQIFTKFKDWRC
jgi:phenylacetate-CoA ligase